MPASGSPGIVRRRDADHDAGVGIALVARILAHAVGDDAARLRGRGDHRAARAHAEAVDRAAVRAVMHQLVVGRAEQRVAGVLAEAAAVDQRLRMLDAEADGEGLRLDRDAARVQHLRTCRARCGRPPARRDRPPDACRRPAPRRDAPRAVRVFDLEIVDAAAEAILAAERLDLRAHLSTMVTRRNVPMCGFAT